MKSFILVRRDPPFVLPGSSFLMAKFYHVIVSGLPNVTRSNLTHPYRGKLKKNVKKLKQITGGKLFHLAGMNFGFHMYS